jgi:putative heme-binding domain-containing protein
MQNAKLAVFLATAGILIGQHAYTPADIEDGGKLYRSACVNCHGPEGNLVPGVDLGQGKFRRAATDDDLVRIILDGIPGTAMPPHQFPEFMAGTIVAYLRSMATTGRTIPVTADPARGKTIFEGKGACTQCHRVNGNGSRLAPDLSAIGARRRTVEMERSILEPDAEILPQNRFYRAVTKDGEIITGRLLNIDTFTVQILDSQERMRSFNRASLRESGFIETSSMPSYRDRLSASELDDLVAYLASLKGF